MSIEMNSRLLDGYYAPKIENPGNLKQPKLPRCPTPQQAREYADAMERYEAAIEEHRTKRKAYHDEVGRMNEQFKQDAIADIFGENAKKFPTTIARLWETAWDDEHSLGYAAVYDKLFDLSEIIKLVNEDLSR